MNTSFYVALALLASVVVAEKSSRSKKEVGYTPYGANTDTNRYLGNAGYSYYNQHQSYSQPGYPYNQQYNQLYNQQYNQPYNQPYNQQYNHQQQLPYQRYNYNNYNNLNNPYNTNQHYQQYNNQAYDGYSSYTGYQNDYQNSYLPGYGGEQNGFGGYPNSVGYNQFGVRQAPAYPSPGFQPARPPAPHPFYHTQGTYYPSQTTEAYKPVAAVDPKKIYK